MNRLSLAALSIVFFSCSAFAVDPDPSVGFPENLTNDQIRACVEEIDDETISYNSNCTVEINGSFYSKEFDANGHFSHLYRMEPALVLSGALKDGKGDGAGDTETYTISAPSVSETAEMKLRRTVAH